MTPSAFQSLMAALIRIGLLLALVIMLMAENAHAQPVAAQLTCGSARIALRPDPPQNKNANRISRMWDIRAHPIA
jgi:hypothetical protein